MQVQEQHVQQHPDRVHGVLVTYRRPYWLQASLDALARQTYPLTSLTIVDNAPDPANAAIIDEHRTPGLEVRYLPSSSNLGPAGGLAVGMAAVLEIADDADWILGLDDDDPPADDAILAHLVEFAHNLCGAGEVGGVGVSGSRLDRTNGRLLRPADEELEGAVPVDYIGGNQLPLYAASAVRAVGVPEARLFFGFDDLEFGLRLVENGFPLYSSGVLHRSARAAANRLDLEVRPGTGILGPPTWRRYYSLRNLIWILLQNGLHRQAVRVAMTHGLGKPVANLPRHPMWAVQHSVLNGQAIVHGFRDRLGLTVQPG